MVRIPRYSSLSAGLPFILSYPRRRNRLPASTGGAEVTGAGPKASDVSGFKDGDTASSATSTNEGEVEKYQIRMATRKQCRGSFAEGPRHPGLSCPPPQWASKKLVKNSPCRRGRKVFKNFYERRAVKALQVRPADFLPPQNLGRPW